MRASLTGIGSKHCSAARVVFLRRLRTKFFPALIALCVAACASPSPAPDQTGISAIKPQIGVASWYGPNLQGRSTANGEIFDQNAMSAAHPTWPMPSLAQVTNLENGKQVVVRVNDRGPFAKDRLIDLSRAAARALGFEQDGHARVKVSYLGPAKPAGKQADAR
jgi:rare lipoprotein A (peptidoglycan hydrolase)